MQVMHPLDASLAIFLLLVLLSLNNQNVSSYTHNPRVINHDNDYNNNAHTTTATTGHYTMTQGIHAGNKYFATFDEFAKSDEFVKQGSRCRTREPTNEDKEISDAAFRKWADNHPCNYNGSKRYRSSKCSGNLRLKPALVTPAKIRVYLHVIRRDDGFGFITNEQLEDSITVLNKAFRPHFEFWFDFEEDVDYSNNSNWYYAYSSDYYSYEMASKLEKKGSGIVCNSDLNVYFISPDNGNLGWTYYPWDCNKEIDGVFVSEASVPKGTATGYNLGYTLVHEVGHWLGLYHTFDGGCDGVGDLVSDTPDEAYAAYGCPKGRDTCPGAGIDPIDNFMNYSDDDCMERFTDGQFTRMIAAYSEFRDPKRIDDTNTSDDNDKNKCNHNDKKSCRKDPSRCCQWNKDGCSIRDNCENNGDDNDDDDDDKNKCNHDDEDSCTKDPSLCCKWKQDRCKKRGSCESNNANICKKYTKKKQCNKDRKSKCCRWSNKTCVKRLKKYCKSKKRWRISKDVKDN